MSGSIGQFLENNQDFNKKSSSENLKPTVNLPVKVTGYENNNVCLGYRLDTKEAVRVVLRDVEQKGKYKRIEISEFADPANRKRFIDPNSDDSYILFENSYQMDDGTWNSRWGSMISKPKKESTVMLCNANMSIVNIGESKFVTAQIIKKVLPIKDDNYFYNTLLKGLTPTAYRSRPSVVFVLKDSGGNSIIHEVNAKYVEDENSIKVAADPNSYIDEIYNGEKIQKLLQLLQQPDVEAKAFIMTTIAFGADTSTATMENSFKVNRIENEYNKDVDGFKTKLYKNTVVAIRERDDKSYFITMAEPLENNVQGKSLDQI